MTQVARNMDVLKNFFDAAESLKPLRLTRFTANDPLHLLVLLEQNKIYSLLRAQIIPHIEIFRDTVFPTYGVSANLAPFAAFADRVILNKVEMGKLYNVCRKTNIAFRPNFENFLSGDLPESGGELADRVLNLATLEELSAPYLNTLSVEERAVREVTDAELEYVNTKILAELISRITEPCFMLGLQELDRRVRNTAELRRRGILPERQVSLLPYVYGVIAVVAACSIARILILNPQSEQNIIPG